MFAANRDELHTRPTAAADWWPDAPTILGGRDLLAGGGWLAVDRRGRLAAITNLPQENPRKFARSRGSLVRDFLSSDQTAAKFAAGFAASSADFGPCNLLLWDGAEFHYAATGVAPMQLHAGVHAISNAPLGADWPRVRRAQESLSGSFGKSQPEASLLELLSKGAEAAAESADAALARRRTEIFITDAHYGTRSSTVIVLGADGRARFCERSFRADGQASGESSYAFSVSA